MTTTPALMRRLDKIAPRGPDKEPDEAAQQAFAVTREPTAAELASLRVNGALDFALRDALPAWCLCALADRIAADVATEADRELLAAFDRQDLTMAGTTAEKLIAVAAEVWRPDSLALAPLMSHEPDAIQRAASQIRTATALLRERLCRLPTSEELRRIGAACKTGAQSASDLVLLRAVPTPWIASKVMLIDVGPLIAQQLWDY